MHDDSLDYLLENKGEGVCVHLMWSSSTHLRGLRSNESMHVKPLQQSLAQ